MSEINFSENKSTRFPPILFASLSLFAILIIYQIGGVLLMEGLKIFGDNSNTMRIATVIGQWLLLLVPALVLAKWQFGDLKKIMRFDIPSPKEVILISLSVIALTIFLEGYLLLQSLIPLPNEIKNLLIQIEKLINETFKQLLSVKSNWDYIFIFFTIAVTPAICEEILFRGFVLSSFNLKYDNLKSVVITGFIFGLFHFNFTSTIALIAIGIYLSYLTYRTGTIVSSMIAHLTNNTVMLLIYFVYPESMEASANISDSTDFANIFYIMILSLLSFYFIVINLPKKEMENN